MRTSKIWKNKLEGFVLDLYFERRKTHEEIGKIIKKRKKSASAAKRSGTL